MIIYNITCKIDAFIHTEWLNWLKAELIPEILNTGCFTSANILQLLETDDTSGPTYAIQFHAENKGLYDRYIENFAALMVRKSFDKWGEQFIAFSSVLKVVN